MTHTQITTVAEAVAALATVIGAKKASFFETYFDRGNAMDVYTHNGEFMLIDRYGMNIESSFPTGKESDDFCYQFGNGQTNVKKVMMKVGERMTIEVE